MKTRTALLSAIFLTLLSVLFTQTPLSAKEAPKKIAILPFTMNADRDLSFLQSGIVDMLNTRLAWKGKVQIIGKGAVQKAIDAIPGPLDKEKALNVGKNLGADYVILGSLTVFGNSVSMDAKILDVAKSDILVTAFDQSKGMDAVIPTINQFAEDINTKITGKEIYRGEAPQPREEAAGPIIPVHGDDDGSSGRPTYVQRYKLEIRGLDVGDVDGDGQNELVMIDEKATYIYKWRKDRLVQFKAIFGTWSPNYVYVSVADLDGNGIAEIYVSDLTATNTSALVYEWDGHDFKEITKRDSWLIRVTNLPGKGESLLGQRRSSEGKYIGDVYVLQRKGKDLVGTEPVNLPKNGNVFNFVKSNLTGKGPIYTTMLDPYEHLIVYNQEGERLWKSDDYFGGTLTYMEYMDINVNRMADTAVRIFIPSPIYLYDINGDGKQEIVVCKNHSKVARIFDDFRWFGSGKVHFMDWDGVGLVSNWVTPKLSGTTVGYKVADIDNDGSQELVVASVTSESYFIGLPQSRIAVYNIR